MQEIDPATAARLKPADSQRIERALEVWQLTGRPLSAHFAEHTPHTAPLDLCTLALIPVDRTLLHAQIAKRFHAMLAQGFLDEVQQLQAAYPALSADMPSMRCVGYRQAWDYLAGAGDYADFTEKGIAATRQLAKRQLTWLRKLPLAHSLDPYAGSDWVQTAISLTKRHFMFE